MVAMPGTAESVVDPSPASLREQFLLIGKDAAPRDSQHRNETS